MRLGTGSCLCLGKHQDRTERVHSISELVVLWSKPRACSIWSGELPSTCPWTFTRPPLWPGPHRLAAPRRPEGCKPAAPTKAVTEVTIADAR